MSHSPAPPIQVLSVNKSFVYHLKTVWLFTLSDIKTIIAPKTAFGIMSALSAEAFGIHPSSSKQGISGSLPKVAFWVWINLLPFAIANQRQQAAIKEDKINKPWRPMPSQRLSPNNARRLMLALYPIAFLASLYLGAVGQCISLMVLGHWYNDHGGSDSSIVTRNVINACGFISFGSGAMEVALGHHPFNALLGRWLLVIGAVVFSTCQIQDIYDQAGDRARGRRTVPLVLGDTRGRWTVAVPMVFWCCFCPWFWELDARGYVLPVALGSAVAIRTLTQKGVKEDRLTFLVWNIWLVAVYLLPWTKAYSGGSA